MPAVFLKSAFRAADLPASEKPQIAMLGRSNVGKSSLINDLVGVKKLARTSAQPGLTQSINLYECDKRYLLVDLPGYGFSRAKRSAGRGFAGLIGEYLSEAAQLKLVLLIIDARQGFMESDRYALDQLQMQDLPFVIVFNKIDKLSSSAAAAAIRDLRADRPELQIIPHSAVNGQGTGEIRDAIERAVRAAK
ncbi:MAG: ribosome biogenesis GTP-binding protein YihA/YsxC [Patescibacteria group bacterium]|jgi:GTP-binding protein